MEEQLIAEETSGAATSYEFDVFLSFRGLDTRKTFTSHLYDRLKSVGFRVYLDEKKLDKGKEINEDLKRAIFNSRVCIPIFSKNYASSKACLVELSHMVQFQKIIIPIFYDVTPDDVKLKTTLYRKDLEGHQGNPKVGLVEIDKWEKALLMVAEKSGYVLLNKNEAEEITAISRELVMQLMPKHQDVTDKLVEIENEVKHVVELLEISSNDFRIVGIFGTGGIGKTTLAKVLFNRLEPRFPQCCSFLENVRENLQSKKLVQLQRQLYKDIINPSFADSIHNHNDGIKNLRRGLENKKFLLVLDDIDDANQLTNLVGHHVHFISGSRIIITTRDRRVLSVLREKNNVLQYALKEMDDDRALKLFSRNAFMKDSPPKEFQRLSKEVVSYTGGLPLAIEVIGSLLVGNSKDDWKETLEELKKFPNKSMESKLMISYQGLKINQQKIFLDIASYYGKLDKSYACYMWEDCGWYPESAIKTLRDRSLIKIINYMGIECFWMHDVLKDLGRAIIQDEGDKSGKIPNGLWLDNNLDILHQIEEKAHVETLSIHAPTITITREDMIGLQKLRFLELNVQKVQGDFSGLLPNLRWFCCSYAAEFKQANFNPKRLLVLDLSYSNFTRYLEGWSTIKVDNLKVLDLSGPTLHYLTKLFSCLEHNNPVIRLQSETLSLGGYWSHLNLMWILNAAKLEKLCLDVAYPVTGLEEMGKLLWLRHLYLSKVIFQYHPRLPSSLLRLTLMECEFLGGILDLSNSKNLKYLEISSPKKLNDMKGLRELYSLEELILEGLDYIKSLRDLIQPKCMEVDPDIEGHSNLIGFPDKMPQLESLEKFKLVDCKNLSCLDGLNILKNLKELELAWCHSLIELPDVSSLKRLSSLNSCWCKNLERILSLDGLERLTSLESLPDLSTLRKLRSLKLQGCDKLRCIQGIQNLESLEIVQVIYCNSLELCPLDFIGLVENVQAVYIKHCNKLPPISKGTS